MNKRLRFALVILFFFGITLSFTSFTTRNNENKSNDEIAVLHQKLDSLSTKVAELEKRVDNLGNSKLALPVPPPNFRLHKNEIPKEWKHFDFNGQAYYMVPLNGSNKNK